MIHVQKHNSHTHTHYITLQKKTHIHTYYYTTHIRIHTHTHTYTRTHHTTHITLHPLTHHIYYTTHTLHYTALQTYTPQTNLRVGFLRAGTDAEALATVREDDRSHRLTEHEGTTHVPVSSAVFLVGVVEHSSGFDLHEAYLPHLTKQTQLEQLGDTRVASETHQLHWCVRDQETGHLCTIQR
jgi:hypothetical protein